MRLRAAEVRRGWRATVALPALRAAVARAAGSLSAIDVSETEIGVEHLRAALRASPAVVELRLVDRLSLRVERSVDDLRALLAAAPQLRELHADVECEVAEVVGLLEGHPPFAPLRVRELFIAGQEDGDVAPLLTLPPALLRALVDARLQPSLSLLMLHQVDMRAPGVMDALADAVVARRHLFYLSLSAWLSPAAVPALARAVRDGALTGLMLGRATLRFLDAAGAAALGDALRANGLLTTLALFGLPQLESPVVAALLGALAGHRSLRVLTLSHMQLEELAAALAALLGADAPALTTLNLSGCELGEEGLGALLDALARNSHLCVLDIRNSDVPAGFMSARLIPAVCANASLQKLLVDNDNADADDMLAKAEAQRIVDAR